MEDIRSFEKANSVSAEKQASELIVRSETDGKPRILFIGNSITLHGVKPNIGWHGLWGMAASAKEKDYVHQTMCMVHEIVPDAGYMILQAANWERGFWKGPDSFENLCAAREYGADILIFRIGENVLGDHMKEYDLTAAFETLIDFLNLTGKAQVIVTDMFWPNPEKDESAKRAAEAKKAKFISINHLGTQDEMKAAGLFEHAGVAAHPGDLGMLRIAEALFGEIKDMLKEE